MANKQKAAPRGAAKRGAAPQDDLKSRIDALDKAQRAYHAAQEKLLPLRRAVLEAKAKVQEVTPVEHTPAGQAPAVTVTNGE